jgi:hypothetical protein
LPILMGAFTGTRITFQGRPEPSIRDCFSGKR